MKKILLAIFMILLTANGAYSLVFDNDDITPIEPSSTYQRNTGKLALGDFNQDGFIDVFEPNGLTYYDESNLLFINDGTGDFPSGNVLTLDETLEKAKSSAAALADFDNDGILDAVVANSNENNVIYYFALDGNSPSLAQRTELAGTADTRSVAAGDLDNDGDIDIVAANHSAQNTIYWNNRDGTFTVEFFGESEDPSVDIALADLNNDTYLDVAVLEGEINVYFNDSGQGFSTADWSSASYLNGTGIDLTDLDGDTYIDIAISTKRLNDAQRNLHVFENLEDETFLQVLSLTCADPTEWTLRTEDITLSDINSDGMTDVLLGCRGSTGSYLSRDTYHLNIGNFQFNTCNEVDDSFSQGSTYGIAAADINNDNKNDIVTGCYKEDSYFNWNYLFIASSVTANNPPSAPTNLQLADTTLYWSAATDDHTAQDLLTYNLRVGSYSGGNDLLTSAIQVGKGNVGHQLSYYIGNLPIQPGQDYYWTVQAVDNAGNTSDWAPEQFVLGNVEPLIDPPLPDVSMNENEVDNSIILDNYVSDDNDVEWSYTILPTAAGVSVEIQTYYNNRAVITPDTDWHGEKNIVFTATDIYGDSDSDVIHLTVNDRPEISPEIPSIAINEDETYTFDLDDYALDNDHNLSDLTWTVSSVSNITIEIDPQSHVVTITPDPEWSGSRSPTFSVRDPFDQIIDDSQQVSIQVSAIDDPLEFTAPLPDIAINDGDTDNSLILDNYIADPDDGIAGVTWDYQISPNADGVTVSINDADNSRVTITADTDWYGEKNITFTATPQNGDPISDTILLSVNDRANITTIPDVTMNEDEVNQEIDLDNYVVDNDHNNSDLSWSANQYTNLTVTIDSVTHVVTIQPDANWYGIDQINFSVKDPFDEIVDDSQPISVEVISVEDTLQITTPLPDIFINENDSDNSLVLDNYIENPDGGIEGVTWSYEISPNSNGVTVSINDADNSRVTIQPDANWYGTKEITFTATPPPEEGGSPVSDVIQLVVNDKPEISSAIPDISMYEDTINQDIDLDNHATDGDHSQSELIWTASQPNNISVEIDSITHQVTIAPDTDWYGTEQVTFFLRDPFDQIIDASQTIDVEVISVDDSLAITTPLPDIFINENEIDDSLVLDNYISNEDGSQIDWTYQVYPDEIGVTINIDEMQNHQVTIQPDADWFGSKSVVFTVSNPSGQSDADTIALVVNDLPQITPTIPDISMNEDTIDQTLDLDNYVTDGDHTAAEMTWTATQLDSITITIDPTTHEVTIEPMENWAGTKQVTFYVRDSFDDIIDDSQTISVDVLPEDDPLEIITPLPDVNINENSTDNSIALDSYVFDPDDPITNIDWSYSMTDSSGVTVIIEDHTDSSRVNLIPDQDWYGTKTITFTASGQDGDSDSDAIILTVNDRPEITPTIPSITMIEDTLDTSIDLDNYVVDGDHAKSSLIWSKSPTTNISVTIDPTTHVVTIQPNTHWYGSENVTFSVRDPFDQIVDDSQAITVTVNPMNDPPEISPLPDITFDENTADSSLALDSYMSDPDDNYSQIDWSYTVSPDGNGITIEIDESDSARVTITPDVDWDGTKTITFTATDPHGKTDSEDMTLHVNDLPEISPIPTITMNEDTISDTLDLDDYVTDNDDPKSDLIWSVSPGNNLSLSIDPTTHIVTVEPDSNWNGNEFVTFYVRDMLNQEIDDSLQTSVEVLSVNDPPTLSGIPDVTFDEDSSYVFNLSDYLSDVDINDSHEWDYSGGDSLNIQIDTTGEVTMSAPQDWFGQDSVHFTVEDTAGAMSSDGIWVTVLPINDAPVLMQVDSVYAQEDSLFEYTFSATDVDPADTLEFSLTFPPGESFTFGIDSQTGDVSFMPLEEDVGDHWFTVWVEDEAGATDSMTVYLFIDAAFLPWDLNRSGVVDMADIKLLLDHLDSYNVDYDVNQDGKLDIMDVQEIADHLNEVKD